MRPMDDPQVLEWWADYLHVTAQGNPTDVTFVTFAAYVSMRLALLEPIVTTISTGSPWYPPDTVDGKYV